MMPCPEPLSFGRANGRFRQSPVRRFSRSQLSSVVNERVAPLRSEDVKSRLRARGPRLRYAHPLGQCRKPRVGANRSPAPAGLEADHPSGSRLVALVEPAERGIQVAQVRVDEADPVRSYVPPLRLLDELVHEAASLDHVPEPGFGDRDGNPGTSAELWSLTIGAQRLLGAALRQLRVADTNEGETEVGVQLEGLTALL